MEYRKERRYKEDGQEKENRKDKGERGDPKLWKNRKQEASQLVIEENTIYEIDLDCQYRKDCKCKKGV